MGGIRRTVDKLNTGQKQAGNIKDKRSRERTSNMILSKLPAVISLYDKDYS
jgi:hypothetical protein